MASTLSLVMSVRVSSILSSIFTSPSFPAFRIDDDSDGAIVGQTDLHVRAKFTGLNAPS
jgi:hypothetical protein